MTLERRTIDLTFQLGTGAFGEGTADTVSVTGRRVSCSISKAGGVQMSQCSLRIYGLTLEVMNKLTVINKYLAPGARRNVMTVTAGGSQCFSGIMMESWADFNSSPEASLVVTAITGQLDSVRPAEPSSYEEPFDAVQALTDMGGRMFPPWGVENNGVKVTLPPSYFPGALRDQALAVAKAADCEIFWDDTTGSMAVWPRGGSRGGLVPVVSSATGMVGYPTFAINGIQLTMLYNPNIVYGGKLKVESILTAASGEWTPYSVSHELESEVAGGKWFTVVQCSLTSRPDLLPVG